MFYGIDLGGFLHDSVDEFDSLNEWDDLLVAVESSPFPFSGLGQFEHHGQAGASCSAALGPTVT